MNKENLTEGKLGKNIFAEFTSDDGVILEEEAGSLCGRL